MEASRLAELAFEQGEGVLRLAPAWVPRSFCVPGRRLKLHPDDYYALGSERGGINERWFASTTHADNGPNTPPDEGMSYVCFDDGGKTERVLLRDAIDELNKRLVGERIWNEYGCWPVYSKFFDNKHALPHHIHHRDQHAKLVGQKGKPEAYYFPPHVNNYFGDFPHTFYGLEPGVTKDQVRQSLASFTSGDNKLTNLSRAYRLDPGTGWNLPPGVLHAPGSLCTYEPQRASDVFANYQSMIGDRIGPAELLWKDTPPDRMGDVDYLMEVIDWEANIDPDFATKNFMRPKPVRPLEEMNAEGYIEQWICYKSDAFGAKELTILPGRTVTIKDGAAYGIIMMQGHGKMGTWNIETPTMIRFGRLTQDEFFVSEGTAREGIAITNPSMTDPIVMLKHFGPANPELADARWNDQS